VNLLSVIALIAVVWYPSPQWREARDPSASPRAQKGGVVRFAGSQSPKSHNAYIDNNTYTKMMFSMMYDNLVGIDRETLEFVPGIASRWAISDDGKEFTFVIDERAKWSDGVKITAYDVKWTFDTIMDPKSDTGAYKPYLGAFESPQIIDEKTVRFRRKGEESADWRDVMKCGGFWILPSHALKGTEFNKVSFEGVPVSGPYELSIVREQKESVYSRVRNWWGKDLPRNEGLYNFNNIVVRYYIDNENAFEALKKKLVDIYPVYSARIMRQECRGDLFRKNRIISRRVKNHKPAGFQGFAMNMRRWPFNDLKVRMAMAKLIDREMMNRTMMYNEYVMQYSIYQDLYDAENPCQNKKLLFDFEGARKLLEEAGFKRSPVTGKLEKNSRPFEFTFLSRQAGDEKYLVHFNAALEKLGITMKIERKDFAAWMRDMDSFNFDMTWQSWGSGLFKTPETMWHSLQADVEQSNNTVGFKSKEVDKLIAEEKTMMSMAERLKAYRKMDKLITDLCPYAFLWNIDVTRLLYWNKFGMPRNVLSRYGDEEDTLIYWWYDSDRADELKAAEKEGFCLPPVPERVDTDVTKEGK
jgi:microcin C transport system substrate-binding protein